MKKLCQIIEESFLQKVNQIVPAAGLALGGAGIGLTLGYDIDPSAVQVDPETHEILYTPEAVSNLTTGAILGGGLGAYAGKNLAEKNPTAASLAGLTVGALGLNDIGYVPGLENDYSDSEDYWKYGAKEIRAQSINFDDDGNKIITELHKDDIYNDTKNGKFNKYKKFIIPI